MTTKDQETQKPQDQTQEKPETTEFVIKHKESNKDKDRK